MVMTEKIQRAIKFAAKTHDLYQKQKRKGKDISYITHPLTIGIILSKLGVEDDVIAAGILHDTIEDSPEHKKVSSQMLAERFGDRVAKIVDDLTEKNKDLSWEDRKQKAFEDLDKMSEESLLVKSADIVSNISELLDDYARYREDVFEHFTSSKEKKINNYLRVISKIIDIWPQNPLLEDLKRLAVGLEKIR
jgi:(p)ppGpp synthase/HD superfamily hydrolase